MAEQRLQFGHQFLDAYMELVEDTESPRIFHVWSALSAVASCLGRRCYLPFGHSRIYPNIYVLLVGSAASRKSTALGVAKNFIETNTDVRIAPASTGGKHQGLVDAMSGGSDEDINGAAVNNELVSLAASTLTKEMLSSLQFSQIPSKPEPRIAAADEHVIYVAASEFNTFIGHGNTEFLEFLATVYDGDKYDYKLKNQPALVLNKPLLNLIGCTTPTSIATAMPAEAIGQGFTSRVIFVFGDKRYKLISRPAKFNSQLEQMLANTFQNLYFNTAGEFTETAEAFQLQHELYYRPSSLTDSRFTYYSARRHTHFLKIGMLLAASRGSLLIEANDYAIANTLLLYTEQFMPDALGEYGLSENAMAKQRIVDFVRASDIPVTHNMLWAMLSRDLRAHQFEVCIQDLIRAEKIQLVEIQSPQTGARSKVFIPFTAVTPETLEIMGMLQTAPTSGRVQ